MGKNTHFDRQPHREGLAALAAYHGFYCNRAVFKCFKKHGDVITSLGKRKEA